MKVYCKKILPHQLKKIYIKFQNYRHRDIIFHYSIKELAYVYRKMRGLKTHSTEIETIAIRGSYADYAFFPKYISNSYNLGLTSTDVYFSYHLYLKLKAMLPHLKNVVYYMNGYASGMSLIMLKEKYRLVSYKYFFDIPYQEEGLIDEKIEKTILKECKNFKTNVPNNYLGYEKTKTYMTKVTAEYRAKSILRENRRKPDQMIWIKKLIDQVIEDKKNIFIVIPPYSTALKACLPPQEELYEKTYNLISNFKDFSNVTLIDLYNSDLFDDSDMGDNDHFNEKGAKKCTLIVKDYLDKKR